MEKELTVEESDKAILEELNIDDDNTNIEDESNTDDNTVIDTDENSIINEEEDDSVEEDNSEEDIDKSTKKPNKFAKLLAKKNEAKREAEEATKEKNEAYSKVQELEERLKTLEEDGDYGTEEYVKAMVDKRMAEKDEVSDFFDEFDELRGHKKAILQYKQETGLNIDKATKLYLAEHNPELLISPQSKAKSQTRVYDTQGRTSTKLVKGVYDYSDKEFDKLAAEGKITF